MRLRRAAGLLAGLLLLAGCGGAAPGGGTPKAAASTGTGSKPAAPAATGSTASSSPPASSTGAVSKTPVPMALGYPAASGTFLPWFVALDQGIFARNGLKVSMKLLRGSATETSALVSGGVQAAVIDSNSALSAMAQGVKVVLIGNTFNGYAFELWAKPGIDSVAALKGHSLGLEHVASLSDSGAHALFAKFGVPFSSVKADYLGSDQTAVAALISGKVDAAISAPPAVFEAQAKGFHLIYNLARIPHVANAIEVTQAFARQHPAEATSLLRSYIEAAAYVRNPANKATVSKDLAGFTRISTPSLLDKTYGYFAQRFLCNPTIAPGQLADAVQWVKQHAHKTVAPASAVNLAPLQALEKNGFVKRTCGSAS